MGHRRCQRGRKLSLNLRNDTIQRRNSTAGEPGQFQLAGIALQTQSNPNRINDQIDKFDLPYLKDTETFTVMKYTGKRQIPLYPGRRNDRISDLWRGTKALNDYPTDPGKSHEVVFDLIEQALFLRVIIDRQSIFEFFE